MKTWALLEERKQKIGNTNIFLTCYCCSEKEANELAERLNTKKPKSFKGQLIDWTDIIRFFAETNDPMPYDD